MRDNILFPDFNGFNQLSKTDKINLLLAAASLAPSTVNTQPWLFGVKDNSIELFLNPSRQLLVSDPTGRQAYISLGACWANLELLADSYGLKYKTQYPTFGKSQPVASLVIDELTATQDEQQIRTAILLRHNNRYPFEKKSLPETFLEKIKLLPNPEINLFVIGDEKTKNEITPIVLDAIYKVFLKKDWSKELSNWVKPSLKKYRDGMPGYNLGVPAPISFLMPWVLRYGSAAGKQLKAHKKMLDWVAAYGIITSDENNPSAWFKTGETFERLAVEAQQQNIKIGILTAPTEIETANKKLKEILKIQSSPQMFFRLGYTEKIPIFSPRLSIKQIIKL